MTIDRNRIYNMDCLDGIRDMLRGGVRVDCVITDPPYLINYQTHRRQDKDHKFCKAIQNDDNPQLIIDLVPLLYDVMKDNTPLYMFCGSDKVDFFKQEVEKCFTVKNLIVWDKGNHTAGDLGAQYGKRYEFIIYANKGRAPVSTRYAAVGGYMALSKGGGKRTNTPKPKTDKSFVANYQSTHQRRRFDTRPVRG